MTNGVKLMFAECCKSSAGAGSSGSSRGSPGGFEPGHRWSRVLRRSTAHRRRTYPGDRDQLQSARQDHVKHKCFLKTIAKVRRSHKGYKNFFEWYFFLIQTYWLQWSIKDTGCGWRDHCRRHTRQEIQNLYRLWRRSADSKRGLNPFTTYFEMLIGLFNYKRHIKDVCCVVRWPAWVRWFAAWLPTPKLTPSVERRRWRSPMKICRIASSL